MVSKPIVIIKLGGSVITNKSRAYSIRLRAISGVARKIASLKRRFSIILIHGAGSYGHIPVKRRGLLQGFAGSKQLRDLAATKLGLLELSRIVNEIMLRHGVESISLMASDLIRASDGRIEEADLSSLTHWLRLGCVPVIGGDIVPDVKRGFSVVSGDQLAAHMAIRLGARKLIFGTDVDGVYDSDPKLNRKASMLRKLTFQSASRLAGEIGGALSADVTGGMGGKVTEAAAAAKAGVDVHVINIMKGDRLEKAVLNRPVLGTRITRS